MQTPQTFRFHSQQIRTILINDQPYFVGKDVTSILRYSNSRDALKKHVDVEDKGVAKCDTLGGKQKLQVINESGLYSLILSSRMPQAKEFKHWVTSEVLPSIRKTGTFTVSQPRLKLPNYQEALRQLADQIDINEQNKPKVDYFDAQMRNPSTMTVTVIAKDYGMSATTFNRLLSKLKIQYRQGKRWVLYQKYADHGYTQYEPYPYNGNKGIANNLKWTQKGKKFLYDLLKKYGIHPMSEQMNLLPGSREDGHDV